MKLRLPAVLRTATTAVLLLVLTVGNAGAQLAPAGASSPTTAKPVAKSADLAGSQKPERGWFFFEDPPVAAEPEPEQPAMPMLPGELPPPPKEARCAQKATWTADCGFVHPGTDFEFQALQRDRLMERMSLAYNDPKAVEAFQYYMRWVLERTAETTNLWWYNMVQNPELDPNVSSPVSAFGLRLMTEVRHGRDAELFSLIKAEGGFFVYFSRHDCKFCHEMSPVLQLLSRRTGLEVRNAALDTTCIPPFEAGCMTAPASEAAAQALQVATVPAVFLYVKPNTWIRVATGIVDLDSILTRTVQFFAAYRAALLSGVENGEGARPSVDFKSPGATGTATGVPGTKAGGKTVLPTEADIADLLGVKRTAP